jgi:hypothetical protein
MSAAEFHRRAVEDALTDAAEQTSVDRKAIALAEAQVHATVLLAEEQRTANLIAAFERDAIQPPHESAAGNRPFWNAVSADISERLDLS